MSLIDATSHQFHSGSASAREKKGKRNRGVSQWALPIAEFLELCSGGEHQKKPAGPRLNAVCQKKFVTATRVD